MPSRTADGAAAAALIGSAVLLAIALAFQYLGGLSPCTLCHWQRFGHLIAIIGVGAIFSLSPGWRIVGLVGALVSSGTGFFHVGTERGWWSAGSGCTGAPDLAGLSAEAALQLLLEAVPVRCDEIAWSMFGLSMAGWNMVFSAILACLWIASLRKCAQGNLPNKSIML